MQTRVLIKLDWITGLQLGWFQIKFIQEIFWKHSVNSHIIVSYIMLVFCWICCTMEERKTIEYNLENIVLAGGKTIFHIHENVSEEICVWWPFDMVRRRYFMVIS